jgi:hypothetical protein
VFVISILVLTSCVHAAGITTPGGVRVDLVGQSGQIKLTPQNATSFTKLKWSKLEEIDANNQVLQSVNNFASEKLMEWGAPREGMYNGTVATLVTLNGSITVGNGNNAKTAQLEITVYVFKTEVIVINGNTTVVVPKDNIKFDVNINNWPFVSNKSRLTFGVNLESQGGRLTATSSDTTTGTSAANKVTFGPGNIVSPKNALVDGVDTPITVTFDSASSTLTWNFPYFASSLEYDPTMAAEATTTGTASLCQPTFWIGALLAALAVLRG